MKYFLSAIIIAHCLIHLLGFIKAFKLSPISQLRRDIPKIRGIFWLLSTILFVFSGALLLTKQTAWFIPSAVAVLISQSLIIGAWSDARYGTIVNILILTAIASGL